MKAAKAIQHIRIVHVFNVWLQKGEEEGSKLCENGCLRAFLFAFDVSFALVFLSEFCFRVRYFLYMSVHHVISVPPFLRKLCSFRFHPVLSFQPCRFDSTVSFVFNFSFVSTPPLFPPCRFCLKVSLHRCFLWPQHVCFFLLPYRFSESKSA